MLVHHLYKPAKKALGILLILVLSIFMVVANAAPVYAETFIAKPDPAASKDTWINQGNPDYNHEDNALLYVGEVDNPDVNDTAYMLIQFDITGLPSSVSSARLQLLLNWFYDQTIDINVHQVTSSWDVETVTWNTMPSYEALPSATFQGSDVPDSVWEWDVTNLYHAWKSGEPNYGMILIAGPDEPVSIFGFYESHDETPSDFWPRLVVDSNLAIMYDVDFDSQGGSPVASSSVVDGDLVDQPVDPMRDGYDFGGWFKEAACLDDWDFTVDVVTADRILYAKWTPVAYPITYELDGGMNHPDNPMTYTIESPDIVFQTPSRAGFDFVGWFDASANGEPMTGIPAGQMGDVTVYAYWTPVIVEPTTAAYHVEHYKEDDEGHFILAETENLTGTIGATVTSAVKVYSGYIESTTHEGRLVSGVVAADGSLVLKRYYELEEILPVTGESSNAVAAGIGLLLLAGLMIVGFRNKKQTIVPHK